MLILGVRRGGRFDGGQRGERVRMPVIRLGLGRAWYGTDAIDIGRFECGRGRSYRGGGGGGRAEGEDVAGVGLVVFVVLIERVVVRILRLAVEVGGC